MKVDVDELIDFYAKKEQEATKNSNEASFYGDTIKAEFFCGQADAFNQVAVDLQVMKDKTKEAM